MLSTEMKLCQTQREKKGKIILKITIIKVNYIALPN